MALLSAILTATHMQIPDAVLPTQTARPKCSKVLEPQLFTQLRVDVLIQHLHQRELQCGECKEREVCRRAP